MAAASTSAAGAAGRTASDEDAEPKLLAHSLLAACARHDLVAVRNLLRNGVSANVQDAETGLTPLHAVVAGCAPPAAGDSTTPPVAASTAATPSTGQKARVTPAAAVPLRTAATATEAIPTETEDRAVALVQLLFENGAIWNDLDAQDETAGCVAWRLGLRRVYALIVEAGVRAEVLLNRLEELGEDFSADDDSDEEEDDEGEDTIKDADAEEEQPDAVKAMDQGTEADPPPADYIDHWDSNAAFLRSALRFTPTQLLDEASNAVMMDWETTLMQRHAATLLPTTGLRAMNIGHGMGIVDTAIQAHAPSEHHIVEAHPAVLARLRETGWLDRPGVVVHEGRWQDVLPRLVADGVEVDAIYYDTFAESYGDFKELFSEHVIGLLDQKGRFGFYHGLGADRRVCYDVYTNVAEMDLMEAGFKTEWEDLSVPAIEWQGVRRPYWNVDVYRLPTCTYL